MDIQHNSHTDTLYRADRGRTYYAVMWSYGEGMTTGNPGNVRAACHPVAFGTKAERDQWVSEGGDGVGKNKRNAVALRKLPYGWGRADFVAAALENTYCDIF